jgi:plasmid segregation protein ParM
MNIGLDIGYSAVKAVSEGRKVIFPSVIGTPEYSQIDLREVDRSISFVYPSAALVGEEAITHSRFIQRREDRSWIDSDEYYTLFLAALTELEPGTWTSVRLVTGLPVAFYSDRNKLRDRLMGEHKAQRKGKAVQTFIVSECKVIPQPFGTLLASALDDWGKVTEADLAKGTVGVIDIGGKSTNIFTVDRLADISRKTASINVGGWDVIRVIKAQILERFPELDLRDHQVVDAVANRKLKYYGETVTLTTVLDEVIAPMADQVIAQVTQLWDRGANLDFILATGGGALLLGDRLKAQFRHIKIVPDPVFANALGFWKFSQGGNAA